MLKRSLSLPWPKGVSLLAVIAMFQILLSSAEAQDQKIAQNGKAGCTTCDVAGIDATAQPILKIRWKRVVDQSGRTAQIHAAAEKEIDLANKTLRASLEPLGIKVVLEKAELSIAQFNKNPLDSNRIWLNGSAFEAYLPDKNAGQVRDEQTQVTFRTVSFGGTAIKDIPAKMIVHVGLLAAASSIHQTMADVHAVGIASPNGSACCSQGAGGKSCCAQGGADSSCCKQPGSGTATPSGNTVQRSVNKR